MYALILTICTAAASAESDCQPTVIKLSKTLDACETRMYAEEPFARAAWNGSDSDFSRYLSQYALTQRVEQIDDMGLSCELVGGAK